MTMCNVKRVAHRDEAPWMYYDYYYCPLCATCKWETDKISENRRLYINLCKLVLL